MKHEYQRNGEEKERDRFIQEIGYPIQMAPFSAGLGARLLLSAEDTDALSEACEIVVLQNRKAYCSKG